MILNRQGHKPLLARGMVMHRPAWRGEMQIPLTPLNFFPVHNAFPMAPHNVVDRGRTMPVRPIHLARRQLGYVGEQAVGGSDPAFRAWNGVVQGKTWSVRVDLGGRSIITKKK